MLFSRYLASTFTASARTILPKVLATPAAAADAGTGMGHHGLGRMRLQRAQEGPEDGTGTGGTPRRALSSCLGPPGGRPQGPIPASRPGGLRQCAGAARHRDKRVGTDDISGARQSMVMPPLLESRGMLRRDECAEALSSPMNSQSGCNPL